MRKVTAKAKVVTDPVVLKELTKQGIDKDYVEFSQDYAPRGKGHSPYAKFYRDLKSDKRIMVVSGLPKVKPTGEIIKIGWLGSGGKGRYVSDANLFRAEIDGTGITLTCLNDQPDGRKEGDQVTWNPQLFIDGVERSVFSGPKRLPVDPTNPDLRRNTLEWDYGVCKRRLRIIQGRITERWVFASDPSGEVRIKHNTTGTMKLRLGRAIDAEGESLETSVIGDSEIVGAAALAGAVYPVEIGASPETFNPDAHIETTSIDGIVYVNDGARTWASIIAAAGTHSDDQSPAANAPFMWGNSTPELWNQLRRGICTFDTSGLPDDAVISAATLSLRGKSKDDGVGITPDINIYKLDGSTPANPIVLAPGDYQGITSIALASPISYAGFTVSDYNDFALSDVDTDDFGYISLTAVSEFSIRNANYDAAATPPSHGTGITFIEWYSAEDGSRKPKLVVTYSVVTGWTGKVTGVTDPGKVIGIAAASIGKVTGVA